MAYEKGSYIDNYKVSILLKEAEGKTTYRVKGPDGKLYALKYGTTESEHSVSVLSDLYIGQTPQYIIYRYVNGETLQTRLMRLKYLGCAEATSLITDILKCIAAFHAHGVAHCHLCSDNIVLELANNIPCAHVVGLSQTKDANAETIAEDIRGAAMLINEILTGEITDKPKVKAGGLSRLEIVMLKALDSEFASMQEMLDALQGDAPLTHRTVANAGQGFSAVAGMESLKQQLQSEVIDILNDKEGADKYGIAIPNGILLYGPPGCGKTFLAERFAEEAGYNYKYVKSSDLASTYLHGSQEKIAELFNDARKNAPTILCFDEFDALVPSRDDINNASHSAEVNEFLTQLNNCGKDGVFVIATSNRPDRIDPAVLRSGRIDYIVYIPIPDYSAREEMFRLEIKERPHEAAIDYKVLATRTEGYLASDIASIVQQASRIAFKAKSEITMNTLLNVIKQRRPSINKATLSFYENIKDRFERDSDTKGRKRVGFSII